MRPFAVFCCYSCRRSSFVDDIIAVILIMIINIICGNYFERKVLSKSEEEKTREKKWKRGKKTDDGIRWIFFTYEHIMIYYHCLGLFVYTLQEA